MNVEAMLIFFFCSCRSVAGIRILQRKINSMYLKREQNIFAYWTTRPGTEKAKSPWSLWGKLFPQPSTPLAHSFQFGGGSSGGVRSQYCHIILNDATTWWEYFDNLAIFVSLLQMTFMTWRFTPVTLQVPPRCFGSTRASAKIHLIICKMEHSKTSDKRHSLQINFFSKHSTLGCYFRFFTPLHSISCAQCHWQWP